MNNIAKIIIRCLLGLFIASGVGYLVLACTYNRDLLPDYLAMPLLAIGFVSMLAFIVGIIFCLIIILEWLEKWSMPFWKWVVSPLKKKNDVQEKDTKEQIENETPMTPMTPPYRHPKTPRRR